MSCQQSDQTEVFLENEADEWFKRNFLSESKQDREKDLALKFLMDLDLNGKRVLEVGCADGWRLDDLKKIFSCSVIGIEPSEMAIKEGKNRHPSVDFLRGTAANIQVDDASVDVLISGFCLYLCDRSELFKIAYEYDRVLKNGGIIVITDFISNFPYKNTYSHLSGMFSYKMDYGSMFTWNPAYSIALMKNVDMTTISIDGNNPDNKITLTVLKKDNDVAYPLEPY